LKHGEKNKSKGDNNGKNKKGGANNAQTAVKMGTKYQRVY
tara:strand:+ start:562 stop:681 length:120 start_codon:yes stop_codon:yes gene_type:complete